MYTVGHSNKKSEEKHKGLTFLWRICKKINGKTMKMTNGESRNQGATKNSLTVICFNLLNPVACFNRNSKTIRSIGFLVENCIFSQQEMSRIQKHGPTMAKFMF